MFLLLLLLLLLLVFFWLRCFSYVRGCSRLGAPERYICDIQIGPGPFSPCSGEEDSGKRGGNRVFQFICFLLLLDLFVANRDLFF